MVNYCIILIGYLCVKIKHIFTQIALEEK